MYTKEKKLIVQILSYIREIIKLLQLIEIIIRKRKLH